MLERPTNLTDWERDKLRLDFAMWLAGRARRFHCDGEQIVDVILSRAKPVHEAVAGSAMSEGVAVAASPETAETESRLDAGRTASATSETMDATAGRDRQPYSPEGAPEVVGRASKPSEEVNTSQAGPVRQADEGEGRPGPQVLPNSSDKPGEAPNEASPAPVRRGGLQERVRELHFAHRDWSAARIATEIGAGDAYVRSAANRLGLTLPSDRQKEPTVASRVAALHAEHPELTAKEAAIKLGVTNGSIRGHSSILGIVWAHDPSAPSGERTKPLRERVRLLHEQHPTWTARMISVELGAPFSSCSSYLAAARHSLTATKPEAEAVTFVGEAALKDHYADVSKRLGAPV
jgi:hypothetical protein